MGWSIRNLEDTHSVTTQVVTRLTDHFSFMYVYLCSSMCHYICVGTSGQQKKKSVKYSGGAATGNCEPPNLGAKNQMPVL